MLVGRAAWRSSETHRARYLGCPSGVCSGVACLLWRLKQVSPTWLIQNLVAQKDSAAREACRIRRRTSMVVGG